MDDKDLYTQHCIWSTVNICQKYTLKIINLWYQKMIVESSEATQFAESQSEVADQSMGNCTDVHTRCIRFPLGRPLNPVSAFLLLQEAWVLS